MRSVPIIAFVFVAFTSVPATAAPTWDFTDGSAFVTASGGSNNYWYAGDPWGQTGSNGSVWDWSYFNTSESTIQWEGASSYNNNWTTQLDADLTFTVSESADIHFYYGDSGYQETTTFSHTMELFNSNGTLLMEHTGTSDISFTLQAGVEYSIVLQASMATGNTTAWSSMDVWIDTPVPAPAALALFGIAGLASKRRRK